MRQLTKNHLKALQSTSMHGVRNGRNWIWGSDGVIFTTQVDYLIHHGYMEMHTDPTMSGGTAVATAKGKALLNRQGMMMPEQQRLPSTLRHVLAMREIDGRRTPEGNWRWFDNADLSVTMAANKLLKMGYLEFEYRNAKHAHICITPLGETVLEREVAENLARQKEFKAAREARKAAQGIIHA